MIQAEPGTPKMQRTLQVTVSAMLLAATLGHAGHGPPCCTLALALFKVMQL